MLSADLDDILEDVFERVSKSRIFKNRDVLMPDFLPNRLPHREEQIRKVASVLAQALKGYRPNNLFLYGLTGTGKTAVVKLVTKKLSEKARERGVRLKVAFVNTKRDDTPYRVLSKLLENIGFRVPPTGIATAQLYANFKRLLDKRDLLLIIVLDEIDYHVKKHGDDLLYKLTRINEELRNSKVSIIGITNDVNFTSWLDPRVKSSLSEEELVFPPYTAPQLEDILRDRAQMAFEDEALEEGVIPFCAALAARERGDARKALDLLRVAGELAEREGRNKVTTEHVKKAWEQIEKDRVIEVVRSLPLHSKLILLAIAKLTKDGTVTYTGEVYKLYKEFTSDLGIETLTLRRVSDLIGELDMLGLISTQVVSRGKRGMTRVINLESDYKSVIKGLKDDPRVAEIAGLI
ncbi:cell division control protein Cdc6 [Ignicoccus islandicus DSM 13165]|uniref:ORC1-type DNA replication protein n=1 Tax=Ignicoccus islandicus DSM 13165 TaxID=940295 RepID=A0A0U3FJG8_9CREN|nr:orc1/cdc6 family replication initiation protein [Ignicoccus islandicus]ALU12006.1 cell division control protein Cdc6 [Ignicoccus islandicus DSM 13165]